MTDSVERQDVTLVPFIQPTATQALRSAGVRTIRQLAELKQLPPTQATKSFNTTLEVTPGKEELVARLNQMQPLGVQLDRLVQRARARLHDYDKTVEFCPWLLDQIYYSSTLPLAETNPDLVRIFLDAQHDYLQNRLYLVGSLVEGPLGSMSFARSTSTPPTDESEKDLLVGLLEDTLSGVIQVARDPQNPPIHLYIYDSYEQKVWLDALGRHIDALCAIPAFFDFLTSSPALEQPMFGVLAGELRETRNLPATCQNLYSVSVIMGFKWKVGVDEFQKDFYHQIFDNSYQRPDGTWAQRFSRFDSHIPLEYAYGAWKQLPAKTPNANAYQKCDLAALERFEKARLAAMSHIEKRLTYKNKWLVKEPATLNQVIQAQATTNAGSGLAQALRQFLHIEHYTALQQLLAHYGLPIERRIQTGQSLRLRCKSANDSRKPPTACFELDFVATTPEDVANIRQAVRIKEGDWLVLNLLDGEPHSPWNTLKGRMGVVRKLGTQELELEFRNIPATNSKFKYWHDAKLQPVPGQCYSLDAMADDLNADKYLAAVDNCNQNILYQYLIAPKPPAAKPNFTMEGQQFNEFVKNLDKSQVPTPNQQAVIAGHHHTSVLCIQGPPGSGKTATLGWAALARLFAKSERPLRVAVCARTHKATNLVLESIAKRLKKISNTRFGRSMGQVRLYKTSGDSHEELPEGVTWLNPYNNTAMVEIALATTQISVIGGTPGGISTLIKQYKISQQQLIDWSENGKLFDLVIIDEASQMGLPEALLAAAWLKPDGQLLVVGDHRQMPPILAHSWKQERKQDIASSKPYRSVFESLIESGFPVVALDRSFRLHRVQAEFLAQNIYSLDKINFYSKREDLLPPFVPTEYPPLDAYVQAVLGSEYPIVVVEHNENTSQQFNPLEIELVRPLIAACCKELNLDGRNGVGVVVPHNAQKAALKSNFPELAEAGAIDTVERFQGGERDVIIVCATASEPNYVLSEAHFLLNLNRLNVAISRPRKKLIVVASTTIFRLLFDDLDLFNNALLWKRLRYEWATNQLWLGLQGVYKVAVFGKSSGRLPSANVVATTGSHNASLVIPNNSLISPKNNQPAVNTSRVMRRERIKEEW